MPRVYYPPPSGDIPPAGDVPLPPGPVAPPADADPLQPLPAPAAQKERAAPPPPHSIVLEPQDDGLSATVLFGGALAVCAQAYLWGTVFVTLFKPAPRPPATAAGVQRAQTQTGSPPGNPHAGNGAAADPADVQWLQGSAASQENAAPAGAR